MFELVRGSHVLRRATALQIAHLVRGDNYRKAFQETGNPEDGVWSAGPVMGLIDDIPTCDALISRIVAEAEDVITGRLQACVQSAGES